jgi:hypothetical protein
MRRAEVHRQLPVNGLRRLPTEKYGRGRQASEVGGAYQSQHHLSLFLGVPEVVVLNCCEYLNVASYSNNYAA